MPTRATPSLASKSTRSSSPIAAAMLLFTAASCVPANHDYGAGVAAGIPPSSTTYYEVQSNTATGVVAGTQAGYGIRTLGGNDFRVIWTGDADSGGGYHEFWGTMWTTGTFSDQIQGCTNGFCPLEDDDFISAPYATTGGQRIDWDTFASDGLDGFEVTTDTVPVYFDLYIDGVRYPNLTFFPDATQNGIIASPTVIPFGIATH